MKCLECDTEVAENDAVIGLCLPCYRRIQDEDFLDAVTEHFRPEPIASTEEVKR